MESEFYIFPGQYFCLWNTHYLQNGLKSYAEDEALVHVFSLEYFSL
jgi:hypothetical protein